MYLLFAVVVFFPAARRRLPEKGGVCALSFRFWGAMRLSCRGFFVLVLVAVVCGLLGTFDCCIPFSKSVGVAAAAAAAAASGAAGAGGYATSAKGESSRHNNNWAVLVR